MNLPALLSLKDENSYRAYFYKNFVKIKSLRTFDGIEVRFFTQNFDHAFYVKSIRSSGKKDQFSWQRAKRMDWIAAILQSPEPELRRRAMPDGKIRRIALVGAERYAVVIQIEPNGRRANFITAYIVRDDESLRKMRSNPRW